MKYEKIIQKIQNNEPFAFTRWGDGEWFTIEGRSGSNTDGNIYYKDLGAALKNIISTKQDYFMGNQSLVDYSVQQSKQYSQDWVDADVFHRASSGGSLDKLIQVLFDKHVVYVGNESLKKLNFINEFIEIPYKNVWLQRNELLDRIRATFDDTLKVYCFSAGMATNVFVDRLWKEDSSNIYLDVGSVFDPYVGRNTRSYHKKLNIKPITKK